MTHGDETKSVDEVKAYAASWKPTVIGAREAKDPKAKALKLIDGMDPAAKKALLEYLMAQAG